MNKFINSKRRQFLQYSGLGLLALSGLPRWAWSMEGMGAAMPKKAPNKASPNFNPDVELELICRRGEVSILPGRPTVVQQYFGKRLKGPENCLGTIPGSYLGPLMRFQNGQKIRVHLRNEMDEPTITHWHGLNVPALMDGHPVYALDKGETFVYEFEMLNRASMILYHPHTHGLTGSQVYNGLAGAILVNDEEEGKLELPAGEYEIPIVIQDRSFDAQNQLVYVRHMHDRMMGFHGDHILVNGRPDFGVEVASRAYRLRILNGSNARIYKLAWDDGTPMMVLGVDGGLLESPVHKPYVMLGPGERIDLWADFSGRAVGSQLVMRSRPFSGAQPKMMEQMRGGRGGGMGMMGGMGGMMGSKIPLGTDYPIFTVRVTRQVGDSPQMPTHLSKIASFQLDDTANPNKPVPIGISEGPGSMLINGKPYAPNDYLPFERIPFNTLQLVEIFHAHGGMGGGGEHGAPAESGAGGGHGGEAKPAESQGGGMGHGMMGGGMMGGMGGMMGGMGGMMGGMDHGGSDSKSSGGEHNMGGGGMGMMGGGGMGGMGGMGMMMSMAHPIHFHEEPFQILSRTIDRDESEDYATVKDGFIDSGWKDTVLVMPGEKIRLIKPYRAYKGVFMVHCHNLEHEDMGMMREFLVE